MPPSPLPELSPLAAASGPEAQDLYFERAKSSLQQLLATHTQQPVPIRAELQPQLDLLAALNQKLNQGLIQIAAFGRVSRGKSALLNALFGDNILPTGPLHGVTQWPRSVRWSLEGTGSGAKVQLELIDTPGLDEVAGEARTQMAKAVAYQADLILFVIAGELSPTEIAALLELRAAQKPVLLVVNKIDLYPGLDLQKLYQTLEQSQLHKLISPDELIGVAAAPAPLQVRVEWPDGRVTYEWEQPPPQVSSLRQKLLQILNREGRFLLALNTLFQAQTVELAIAAKLLHLQAAPAEALLWRWVRAKALAVALNPLVALDLGGGALADLLLVRNLVKLYGLSIARPQAGKLGRTLLLSSGGLLLSQLGSGLLLGFGPALEAGTTSLGHFSISAATALVQAAIAAYGTYMVGQTTRNSLTCGNNWGPLGPSRLLQEILNSLEPDMILNRMRPEFQEKLWQSQPLPEEQSSEAAKMIAPEQET